MATRPRKTADSEVSQDIFISLPEPQRDAIRSKLLECLAAEQDQNVRHKIGDAIAEVSRQYIDAGSYMTDYPCSHRGDC